MKPNDQTQEPIRFYSVADEYGELSNFAMYPIRARGRVWPTSEHFFQAMKFKDRAIQEKIRKAKTPMLAARMGRDRRKPLRRDWESIKVGIMREALKAKFTQHDELQTLLLGTGEAAIIEHTTNDDYWGDGGNGRGRNMLGRLLVEIRQGLQGEAAE